MSRFASPHRQRYEPKPRQVRRRHESDWQSDTSQQSGYSELPLPPPPFPPDNSSDSQSTISSSTLGTRRGKSPAWFDNRDPKPLLRGRSVLLANQLISTLNIDRGGPSSPASIMFPSRHMESSGTVRSAREEIADMKAEWSNHATTTIKHVQNLSAMISHCRQQREMLNQRLVEQEYLALNKTEELEDLYLHLEALEKVAADRRVTWVRPPLIRSDAKMVSPRNTALSVASAGASVGSGKSSSWRVALRQLISPAKHPVTLNDDGKGGDDSMETNAILASRGSAIAMRDRLTVLLDPEVPHDDALSGEGRRTSTSPGQREAPRAPLGRPGGLVHQEIQRVSPDKQIHQSALTPVTNKSRSDGGESLGARGLRTEDEAVTESFKNGRVIASSPEGMWRAYDTADDDDGNDGRDEVEEEIEFKRVSEKSIPMNRWVTGCSPHTPSIAGETSAEGVRVLSTDRGSVAWKAEKVSLTSAFIPPPPSVPHTPTAAPGSSTPRGHTSVNSYHFDATGAAIDTVRSSASTTLVASTFPITFSEARSQGMDGSAPITGSGHKTSPAPAKVQRSLFATAITPPPPPPPIMTRPTQAHSVSAVSGLQGESHKAPTSTRAVTPKRTAPRPPQQRPHTDGDHSESGRGVANSTLQSTMKSLSPAVEIVSSEGTEEEKLFDSFEKDCIEVDGRWPPDSQQEEASGMSGHVTLEDIATAEDYLQGSSESEEGGVGPGGGRSQNGRREAGNDDSSYHMTDEDHEIDDDRFRYIPRCEGSAGEDWEEGALRVPTGNALSRQSDDHGCQDSCCDECENLQAECKCEHTEGRGPYDYDNSEDAYRPTEDAFDGTFGPYDGGDGGYGRAVNACGGESEMKRRPEEEEAGQKMGRGEYNSDYAEVEYEDEGHRGRSEPQSPSQQPQHSHGQRSPAASTQADNRRPFQLSAAKLFAAAEDYHEDEGDGACDEQEEEGEDVQQFEVLRESVMKNKWCRGTLRRLSCFDSILNSLKRCGNCHRFLKKCCPEEYIEGCNADNKTILELPLSVAWMEGIALKLGTFWALPERTFLEECLFACDPTGVYHTRWLSLLLLSCHPNLYNKRDQFKAERRNVSHAPNSTPWNSTEGGCVDLFEMNGDATTLLPGDGLGSSFEFAGAVSGGGGGKLMGRRVSVASAAPAIARQLSREEQLDIVASNISHERNRYIGDLTKKERRASMLKAEQGWNTHFASQKKPVVSRTFSGGLGKYDEKEDEALRSSQFESIPVASHRTRTTDFSTAMSGRGELGTGRNWTGSTGAKGLQQSEREDIIRTAAILQHLPRETHQLFLAMAKTLKAGHIPVERIQTDLHLHFPHGYLDNNDDVRIALKLSGRHQPSSGEVALASKFLSYVAEHVEVGQVKDESGKVKRSGIGKNKLMQWRDLVLALRSVLSNYGKK